MKSRFVCLALSLAISAPLAAQLPKLDSTVVARFVSVNQPVVAITDVLLIDGTGKAARPGQTVVLRDGKIEAVGPASSVKVPTGATVDVLVEFSNPGRWMVHCHIAEHLQAGMMMVLDVEEA